jgi:hypothetical protein
LPEERRERIDLETHAGISRLLLPTEHDEPLWYSIVPDHEWLSSASDSYCERKTCVETFKGCVPGEEMQATCAAAVPQKEPDRALPAASDGFPGHTRLVQTKEQRGALVHVPHESLRDDSL